jgi:hypothetical protein
MIYPLLERVAWPVLPMRIQTSSRLLMVPWTMMNSRDFTLLSL